VKIRHYEVKNKLLDEEAHAHFLCKSVTSEAFRTVDKFLIDLTIFTQIYNYETSYSQIFKLQDQCLSIVRTV